ANTALEAKANDLYFALNRAEEASRAKNEFLATMSHELRTPLNAIIGFSEVMERESFGPIENDHYKDYVKDIAGSGRHLLAIVNDILDLARIESGNDVLYEDEFEPDLVAEAMLRIVGPQAVLKDVKCSIECADELPLLFADQRKFKQILINLLNNAIKFNVQGGTVTLFLSMHEGCLHMSVVDTGIGMEKEDIPRALARFQQVDGDLARRFEGLGIGLSLVDALVAQHDGELKIESEVGRGTSVIIRFPQSRSSFSAKKATM
ncbi:MAG: HAMP domain-containing sensor histidine kinase, partial [Parvibaculum sp.]